MTHCNLIFHDHKNTYIHILIFNEGMKTMRGKWSCLYVLRSKWESNPVATRSALRQWGFVTAWIPTLKTMKSNGQLELGALSYWLVYWSSCRNSLEWIKYVETEMWIAKCDPKKCQCVIYLSNWYQRVVVDRVSCIWFRATSGVPQGSILGSLLFLTYRNTHLITVIHWHPCWWRQIIL